MGFRLGGSWAQALAPTTTTAITSATTTRWRGTETPLCLIYAPLFLSIALYLVRLVCWTHAPLLYCIVFSTTRLLHMCSSVPLHCIEYHKFVQYMPPLLYCIVLGTTSLLNICSPVLLHCIAHRKLVEYMLPCYTALSWVSRVCWIYSPLFYRIVFSTTSLLTICSPVLLYVFSTTSWLNIRSPVQSDCMQ